MDGMDRLAKAIREEGLRGWLFYSHFHRDRIADRILGIRPEAMNTRPWVYLVHADRPPVKIVHGIEASALEHLPGSTVPYVTREQFRAALEAARPADGPVAADYSEALPVLSFLDHGMALLLRQAGYRIVPADGLIRRFLATMDEAGYRSHQEAAGHLYDAVETAWKRLRSEAGRGAEVREGAVQEWMTGFLEDRGLVFHDAPVVAFGRNSSDPHYAPRDGGAALEPGDVVLLDLWGKKKEPGAVYADISWMGVAAKEAGAAEAAAFGAVVNARDRVIRFLTEELGRGRRPSGAAADREARRVLEDLGLASGIRHRTGHAIGEDVHGFGVNLDCAEFPDERLLDEGSCFSIEPGLYLDGFGVRTEVDACIRGGALVVTGGRPQSRFLTL